jgi:hypothetical protein
MIYNSAIVGNQFHTDYNRWEFPGSIDPTIRLAGTTNPNNNQYWRPNGVMQGTPMFPTTTIGAGLFMPPGSTDVDTIPDPSNFCTSAFDDFTEFSPDPDPEEFWASIVRDTSYWNGLTPAEHSYMRQEVYGLLLENPGWASLDTTLSGFQTSESSDFVGESETLRHTWQQMLDDISAHQESLEPLYSSVDSLAGQAQLWIAAMSADTTLQDSLEVLLAVVLQEGDSLNALIQEADSLFYPSVIDTITQLRAENATLDEDSLYTWYEKRYNEIVLKWMAGAEPDSAATADLRQMAQTCLRYGGRAVLWARGLCAVWLDEYYDEGNCDDQIQGRDADGPAPVALKTAPSLRILPNPAQDEVRLSLQTGVLDKQQVWIFDANGRQVYSGVLPTSGELAIPVRGWQNGLYIAKVSGGALSHTQSFIVQHP